MYRNRYEWDRDGLPVYNADGMTVSGAKDRTGEDAGLPADPCFILGNYRLTAFAHLSGQIELLTGERGWMRINHQEGNHYRNRSKLEITRADRHEVILLADDRVQDGMHACFGAGYACYRRDAEGVTAERKIMAFPSEHIHSGIPALVIRVTTKNTGSEPVRIRFTESLLCRGCMLSFQGDQEGCTPVAVYENRLKQPSEGLAEAVMGCRFMKTVIPAGDAAERHPYDCFPPVAFMRVLENGGASAERTEAGDELAVRTEFMLRPGERKTVSFLEGLSHDGEAGVEDCIRAAETAGNSGAAWKRKLPEFGRERDEGLRWEMIWNAYVLECMATYHRYFGETFIPQGSVYAYRLGQNTSQRDHLQHLLPEILLNPELAKSCLRFVLKHMCENGRIIRQDVGYGYEDQDVYWESDPQLYLFMAAGMYLEMTEDTGFLQEEVPFYPVEYGRRHTVEDALVRAFAYLRDVVRLGRHGLVMMRNSDWSDSFFHPYSPNLYAQVAESHMNTTMALAVMPRFIREMKKHAGEVRQPWIREMEAWTRDLFRAFMTDLGDRVYAPRCYIGFDDDPKLRFGEDRLCLEAQVWLLQAPDFPLERKQKLWQAVRKKLLDSEKLGARTREYPLWEHAENQGEDGGIWFAHQGALMQALAGFDPEEGKLLLHRLTFRNYADNYPEYWLGQWTAPDSFESTLSRREGLYAAWTDHPFLPFCAHVHAWNLLGYLLLYCRKDRDPDQTGIVTEENAHTINSADV